MAFVENFPVFFNIGEFADAATLDGAAVVGIFDGDYVDLLNGTAEGSGPAFTLQTDDAVCAHGSDLIITTGRGTGSYKVRIIEPDGTGVTVLRLERQ
jgi:hypothetical protein